ncbi:MAG: hypothetical protein ACHQ1D_12825, partial [Nitrososphaerales archaeon]
MNALPPSINSKTLILINIILIFIALFLNEIVAQEADIETDTTDTEGTFVGIVEGRAYENTTAGEFTPGKGFTIFKTSLASLNISVYGLARYINQMPPYQSYEDHLGRTKYADTRNDIWWHRTFVWFSGFFYTPKLRYTISVWGLTATNQVLIFGNLQYSLNRPMTLGVGIVPNLGTRSMQGPWPYFLGSDRVLAEEFFRPGFTTGAWVTGEPISRFRYWVMFGNNLSQLGIGASQMSRFLSTSASVWWMPTTGEFGPRGGNGDFEHHKKLATRFGASFCHSRESRHNNIGTPSPDNTQVRMSDGLLFFETGALAPNVTIEYADYDMLAVDLGFKYKGLAIHTELYYRTLSKFDANGQLPYSSLTDIGYTFQVLYMIVPKKVCLYGISSM